MLDSPKDASADSSAKVTDSMSSLNWIVNEDWALLQVGYGSSMYVINL